jgi:hypothetical protein
LETRSSQTELTAGDVISAQLVISHQLTELNVIESSQLAVALRSMTKLDMLVYHAHHTKLLPTETQSAHQDNAQVLTKSLVQLINAMHARNVTRDLLQTT